MHRSSISLTSASLAAFLLLPALLSCGKENPDTLPTEKVTIFDTAAVTEAVSEGPEFPALTFGGEDIHFLTENNSGYDAYSSKEIYAEKLDGSLINDTVYQRNLTVEDRFDIHITEERLDNASSVARETILSGDDLFDVVMPYMNASIANALEGQYYNLCDVENLHLENTWWDQSANESLMLGDNLYFTTGDISILDNECTMVLFFNKQYPQKYDLQNPYDLVKSGKWTIEEMHRMSASAASDLNGDSKMKVEDDQFGVGVAFNVPLSFFFGTGERITDRNENGDFTLVMNNPRSVNALDRIFELCFDDSAALSGFDQTLPAFLAGRFMFVGWALTDINSIRNSEFDFGILPYPKLDEEQDAYYSLISTALVPGVSIPTTNQEPQKAGLILEAMAYYSVDTLTKAYYETALNDRYIRDEDSGEMLDIIFASRVYDFGYIKNIGGLGELITQMWQNKKNNFASRYEKLEKKAQKALDELTAAYSAKG